MRDLREFLICILNIYFIFNSKDFKCRIPTAISTGPKFVNSNKH